MRDHLTNVVGLRSMLRRLSTSSACCWRPVRHQLRKMQPHGPDGRRKPARMTTWITLPPGSAPPCSRTHWPRPTSVGRPNGVVYVNTWSGGYYATTRLLPVGSGGPSRYTARPGRRQHSLRPRPRGRQRRRHGHRAYASGLFAEVNDRIVRYACRKARSRLPGRPRSSCRDCPSLATILCTPSHRCAGR